MTPSKPIRRFSIGIPSESLGGPLCPEFTFARVAFQFSFRRERTVNGTLFPLPLQLLRIHMADYDFVFWIDADALFYEQSLRLEEVLQVDERPEATERSPQRAVRFSGLPDLKQMEGGRSLFL